MNSQKNLINKEHASVKGQSQAQGQKLSTYKLGLNGQDYVELKMQQAGYSIYKKNFKKIGVEIDLIVYKYVQNRMYGDLLIIHIIEVKTRKGIYVSSNLDDFGIFGKWRRVKLVMFDISSEIKKLLSIECAHKITFDLAIVSVLYDIRVGMDVYKIKNYIRNVNLLL